ncbi:DUF6508 domain-containing protein [Paenibacillus agricola]|uniref:Uncharacterized protein n=1 Tax=Paenibacillus agricola TaxID=2716264 RepID=A0ABX0JJ25_9BACL|nr:DUF6508 domain-containing protein [Paenibacillus agricola]NHN35404.1 hypothetical protein [Paenibacillus agricola]
MAETSYSRLLEFIFYFEDVNVAFCKWSSGKRDENGVYTMPYPIYDDRLKEFIQAVYDSDLMMNHYLNYIKKIGSVSDIVRGINDVEDMDTLRAFLTYFVRQERFCDGLWAKAAEDKIFLQILLKLRELTDSE